MELESDVHATIRVCSLHPTHHKSAFSGATAALKSESEYRFVVAASMSRHTCVRCSGIHTMSMSNNTWSVRIHWCKYDSKKRPLLFFFFFFFLFKSKVQFSSCVPLIAVLHCLLAFSRRLSHQQLGGYEALWTRRCPAMREVSPAATVR